MKAKLITDDNNNYSLLDSNNNLIATTMESMVTNQKLSLKNCEAIKNGYNLDELSFDYADEIGILHTTLAYSKYFKSGFQKALELLGDKKFSEGEMRKSFEYGATATLMNSQGRYNLEKALEIMFEESLQQNEWDVEMEMECCGNYKPCNINCEYGPKPKLDENGCLILNKKL